MHRNKIQEGTIVHPISRNRGIAIFRTDDGGRFIKVKHEADDWRAVTLLSYRGPGLVVFLNDISEFEHVQKIGTGEILRQLYKVKISAVHEKYAIGEVIRSDEDSKPITYSPELTSSDEFKNLFNDLCDKVDSEYNDTVPLASVEFHGTLFAPDECATILKVQDFLYGILDNEDSNDRADGSDFEAGNS